MLYVRCSQGKVVCLPRSSFGQAPDFTRTVKGLSHSSWKDNFYYNLYGCPEMEKLQITLWRKKRVFITRTWLGQETTIICTVKLCSEDQHWV